MSSIHIVDFSNETYRWLFQLIYARLSPLIAKDRLTRILVGDKSLVLLIQVGERVQDIQGHCLLFLQNTPEGVQGVIEELEGVDIESLLKYVELELAPSLHIHKLIYLSPMRDRKKLLKLGFALDRIIGQRVLTQVESE